MKKLTQQMSFTFIKYLQKDYTERLKQWRNLMKNRPHTIHCRAGLVRL